MQYTALLKCIQLAVRCKAIFACINLLHSAQDIAAVLSGAVLRLSVRMPVEVIALVIKTAASVRHGALASARAPTNALTLPHLPLACSPCRIRCVQWLTIMCRHAGVSGQH